MNNCVMNINAKDRLRRRISGIVFAIIALGTFLALVLKAAPTWYRTGLFLPLFLAVLGFLQAGAGI